MDQLKERGCYEFQRLVFGLNTDPFKAQCISQNVKKQKQKKFPLAAETVL